MDSKTEAVEQFEQFAKERTNNHLAELNTRYENEQPDKELLQQAYRDHREILKKELDDKIQPLLSSERNSGLKENLDKIKASYLAKLELKNQ
jgi:vacuolar-type H+-ATPase subunit H